MKKSFIDKDFYVDKSVFLHAQKRQRSMEHENNLYYQKYRKYKLMYESLLDHLDRMQEKLDSKIRSLEDSSVKRDVYSSDGSESRIYSGGSYSRGESMSLPRGDVQDLSGPEDSDDDKMIELEELKSLKKND